MLLIAPVLETLLIIGVSLLALLSLHLTLLSLVRLLFPRRRHPERLPPEAELPEVLIQVPLYNEGELAARILGRIAELDWPRERLAIQVLDDSTDGSLAASRAAVDELRSAGWRIELYHRAQRTAFKAGALAAGLAHSDAPFVAIFDADFLPPPEFLRRTLGVLLANNSLAYVQSRWLHANADVSLLTRIQARLLDGHFRVEQEARHRLGLPTPFNGTCGVWRRSAIDDAGGWHGDTLTEDLDLSLRARLRGWRSAYLQDLGVPGMLPESPRAWRMQQFRWTKGFVECLVKHAPGIWKAEQLPRWQRVMIILQMAQPLAFLLGCLSILIGLPFIAGKAVPGPLLSSVALRTASIGPLGPLLLLTIGALGARPLVVLREALSALLLTSGLLLSNGRAGLEALLRVRSEFVRTPKRTDLPRQVRRKLHCGLPEVAAGGALLAFVLVQQPLSLPALAMVIGGLLGFGTMQMRDQGHIRPQAG